MSDPLSRPRPSVPAIGACADRRGGIVATNGLPRHRHRRDEARHGHRLGRRGDPRPRPRADSTTRTLAVRGTARASRAGRPTRRPPARLRGRVRGADESRRSPGVAAAHPGVAGLPPPRRRRRTDGSAHDRRQRQRRPSPSGEGWLGAAVGETDYLAMVVSTGVGGGIVLGGHLLQGRGGNAGHIGHVVVEHDGRPCSRAVAVVASRRTSPDRRWRPRPAVLPTVRPRRSSSATAGCSAGPLRPWGHCSTCG